MFWQNTLSAIAHQIWRSQVLPGYPHNSAGAQGCVHSRVVEGSWEGISGCVVCMESVYVVGGCNVVATEHGRYSLLCIQKL